MFIHEISCRMSSLIKINTAIVFSESWIDRKTDIYIQALYVRLFTNFSALRDFPLSPPHSHTFWFPIHLHPQSRSPISSDANTPSFSGMPIHFHDTQTLFIDSMTFQNFQGNDSHVTHGVAADFCVKDLNRSVVACVGENRESWMISRGSDCFAVVS